MPHTVRIAEPKNGRLRRLLTRVVAFDWDNQQISIAQGASCGAPDLVATGKGPDAVKGLVGNCR